VRDEACIGVVIGTRPEAIKLAPVVYALQETGIGVRVCLTEQHNELLEQGLRGFDLPVDERLGVMSFDQGPSLVCSRVMAGISAWLTRHPQMRWLIVQGDTTSAIAAALAGFHARIPVAHVEAGLRTGDPARPWPEEMHRRLIAQVASVHFAPTDQARTNLIDEGISPASIEVTGNTVVDALRIAQARSLKNGVNEEVAPFLQKLRCIDRPIILATVHRRENLGVALESIGRAMATIASRGDCELVLARHPNPRATRLAALLAGRPHAHIIPPMDYASFIALLLQASFIMTDSGGLQEEAAALGKPILIIREKTERMEVILGGNGVLVGVDADSIVSHAERLLADPAALAGMSRRNKSFGDGFAADRIARRLAAVSSGERA
jgi:UDP-N-acetylglucosamine 2-epimerase (non-hydrolysing)